MDAPDGQICAHLAPALRRLLAQGCLVIGATTQAWSRVDREVSLDHGPAPATLQREFAGTDVNIWSNTDPHYPMQHGLFCSTCRHSLGWPLRDEPANPPDAG